MDNFDLKKYLAEGRLLKEDIASKAISVLKSYEGEVEGVEGYIKYLMNTSDDISSSIQAIADDLDRDKPSSDSLRRDLEKLSLAEGSLLKEDESVLKDILADLEQEKKDIFRYMKTDPTYKPEGGLVADYYNQELDRIESSIEKIRKQLDTYNIQ